MVTEEPTARTSRHTPAAIGAGNHASRPQPCSCGALAACPLTGCCWPAPSAKHPYREPAKQLSTHPSLSSSIHPAHWLTYSCRVWAKARSSSRRSDTVSPLSDPPPPAAAAPAAAAAAAATASFWLLVVASRLPTSCLMLSMLQRSSAVCACRRGSRDRGVNRSGLPSTSCRAERTAVAG